MLNRFITPQSKSITALVMMAFLGALMGVWVRLMGEHFELYQQVSARAFAGFILGFLLYYRYLRAKVIRSMSKKDLILLLSRSLVLVIGVGLFTASILNAKFANVNFIFALPMTALLGIIFLKEKLTLEKFLLLLIAFIGVVLISVNDLSHIFEWGFGETLALISTFFYSLYYIMRKWISPALDDKEIAVLHTFFVFMFAFMFSQILGEGVSEFAAVPLSLVLVVFLAGTTFISLAFFSSYAFKRVEAIIANNILILESVFALLIGLAVYQEVPTFKEILGGILIVLSAVLMNKVQFGNKA